MSLQHSKPVFLLGLGAQKAGTTWLSQQLAEHPAYLNPPVKELHYWDRRFHPKFFRADETPRLFDELYSEDKGMAFDSVHAERLMMDRHEVYYRAYFERRLTPDHAAFGDFTPSYCILSANELRAIQNCMAGYRTKAIFIMRDPVERLWSQCRMEWAKRQARGKDFDPYQAFDNGTSNLKFWRRSNYRHTVTAIDQCFEEDDRLYLFYDQLFEMTTIGRVLDFAGLSDTKMPIIDNPNVGLTLEAPTPTAWRAAQTAHQDIYDFVSERFGDFPPTWRQSSSAFDS